MKLIAKNGPAAESELPVEISVGQVDENVAIVATYGGRKAEIMWIIADGTVLMNRCSTETLGHMGFSISEEDTVQVD